jgi:hypothetical protein
MTKLVKVDPKEYGLEEKNVTSIVEAFQPKIAEREGLAEVYKTLITQEISEDLCVEAKALRLKLVKVRTGIAAVHTTQKAYFLASGKYVDAWKNKETLPVTQMEEKLSEIEKHFENLEKERIQKLSDERYELCKPYVEDESLIIPDLGTMPVALWDNYIIGLKSSYEAKKAEDKRLEDERIAKEKAEAEERERIRKENEQLKKEAEERERIAKIEAEKREKAEKERQAKEDAERKNREEKERKEKETYEAKLKAEREEKERIEREERLKREKVEAELRAVQEAELKAKEEEEARKQSELNKGDAAKVKDLISDLEALKTKYSFKSAKNNKMYARVGLLIDKVINDINN